MVLLEVDPNLVRPGWTPLVVLVLLGIVLFFLGRSMIKQFGKIDVTADHEPTGHEPTGHEPPAHDPGQQPAGPASGGRSDDERTVAKPSGAAALPDLRRQPSGTGDGGAPSDRG